MKNDIVTRYRNGGLPDPKIKWPVMHFEAGGGTSDTGVGSASGVNGMDAQSDAYSAPESAPSGGFDMGEFAGVQEAINAQQNSPFSSQMSSDQVEAALNGMFNSANPSSSNTGALATNGMSLSELTELADMGFGDMDISETQNVNQAIASMNMNSFLGQNMPTLMSMLNPAIGPSMTVARGVQGLLSGQVSPGQTAVNTAISMVANQLGLPTGVVAGVVNGNFGSVASSATISAVTQGLSQALGLPPGMVSAAMGSSGATSALGKAVSGSVNTALGASPSGPSNTSAIASAIDGRTGGLSLGATGASPPSSGDSYATKDGGGFEGLPDSGGALDSSGLVASANNSLSPSASFLTPSALTSLSGLSPSSIDYSKIFLDSKPDFLTSKITDNVGSREGIKQQELRQILEAPQMVEDSLYGNYFAGGGSIKTCFSCELSKSFLPETTDVFMSSTSKRRAPFELAKLRHIHPKISAMGNMEGMARGGLPKKYHDAAPEGHNTEFVTGLTGFYACGRGTGQSDCIPAMLHDGDYVMDAEAVSALGDGSSKAGREVLEKFHKQVPYKASTGGKVVPAKIADGEYVFPAGFVTAIGGGDNKRGAEILDGLREKLRNHKRSAPTSKIPPKAKSPLDYLKMAKG